MSPSDAQARPPFLRSRRGILLLALAVVVVVAVGSAAALVASFDPNTLKPRIADAVKRATGRDLALHGPIGLTFALRPTIEAHDVAFANPAGFSRPQMATLDRLRLELDLLPLLSGRVEISRLALVRPDILLETDPAGHPNWTFTPPAPPPAQPQSPSTVSAGNKTAVSIAAISVQDGTVAYRDDRTGKVVTLSLATLRAEAASPDAPLHLETDASYNGIPFSLTADTGGLARLLDRAATTAWPVRVALAISSATFAADGAINQPLLGKGYDLAVNGAIPDPTVLAPLLPGRALPALRDVRFTAKVADQGGEWPAVSAFTLHAGSSDLTAEVPNLVLTQADIAASALDRPITVSASGRLGETPLAVSGTLGAPALLLPDAGPKPFPVDVAVTAAAATLAAKGTIADARAMTGVSVGLAAQIPDLSLLSPLFRTALPPLKSVALQATLSDAGGGFRNGAALHGLTWTNPDADLSGDASITLGPRRSVVAALRSSRIDLDALQAAFDQTASYPSGTQSPAPPPGQPEAEHRERRREERIFSDRALPFEQLRQVDGDVRMSVDSLLSRGTAYKSVFAHIVLTDGKLALDPVTASPPQGHVDAKLTADASQPAPPVHLAMRATGLAMKSILSMLRQPGYASGDLDVYADLSGAGISPHAIAASLDGSLGLAAAGGTLDNRALGSILGQLMDPLNALNLVGRGGASELRCLGLRVDAQHGIGTIRTLLVNSSLLTMSGGGSINLGEETLAMTLRPEARIAGTAVIIPVNVSGPMRAPRAGVNRLGTAGSNVGAVAGAMVGNATPLGVLGGLLGADKLTDGGGGETCAAALAAARGGELKPEAEPGHGRTAPPALSNPEAAIRNLFR